MNDLLVYLLIIGGGAIFGVLACSLIVYFQDEQRPEPLDVGPDDNLIVGENHKYKRGDYVELRNGMNATITDVDTTCIRARINGLENVSQTFNKNGRHIDYDFLDIVKLVNRVDMIV